MSLTLLIALPASTPSCWGQGEWPRGGSTFTEPILITITRAVAWTRTNEGLAFRSSGQLPQTTDGLSCASVPLGDPLSVQRRGGSRPT
jgi:hypothetical protein